ncbi:hypothetical protein [Demequina rhizosphaerae]|uniref:hypothetical protein n=1 Tax=Demequina rhizosphaerae TaxID=1638985 RepID=UPI000782C0FC|nr:hypothetical protein [Demequina rhizosphaerae]
MSDDAPRLDILVRMLTHAFDLAFDEALADRSSTRAEFVMLSRLADSHDPVTWEVLEGSMPVGYGPGLLTETWNALAVAGWADEVDGLRVATQGGREALDELHAAIDGIATEATAGIAAHDVEVAAEVLRHMLDNLDD